MASMHNNAYEIHYFAATFGAGFATPNIDADSFYTFVYRVAVHYTVRVFDFFVLYRNRRLVQ